MSGEEGGDVVDGALSGIRVVELGQLVSAPYCAKLFADFGADVIKVELPPDGDAARRWGPFPDDVPNREASGLHQFANTNKRGITLDVTAEEGRDLFLRLVEGTDVLVENNSPAWMRGAGLDYPSLAALNPDLVMISITPFGQTGPYRDWNGCDLNAFHVSAAGHRYCGRPGEAPLQHGTFSADFYGAVTAATWGLAATVGRERVGSGQHLDVSCAEALAATFVGGQNIGGYAQDGIFDRRTGVSMGLAAPAAILPCKDGHVWMLVLEAGQWDGLVRVMGNPEWAQPEMFRDMFVRGENKDLIHALVGEWTMERTKAEIMEICQAEGVPATAVLTAGEAADLPHLHERGYFAEVEHPQLGKLRTLGAPFILPESPGGPRTPAPRLGQHNDEILGGELGVSAGEPGRPARPGRARPPAKPLEGIRVANFGWVWAGPVIGQTLAFLGAEVYKIESQARLDIARTLPPFAEGERDVNRSLSQHACWAGNGSVTLNLKEPRGIELVRELIAECDVVVENFGPGVMDKLGLGYSDLVAHRPDLVMLSMSATGQFGPLRSLRTYGLSLASITGLDSVTGYLDGPPMPMENAFADPYNGILSAFAIIVALAHRDRTGQGQHIDYSQQEAVMQMVGPAFMDYVMNGRVGGPLGNRHPLAAAAPHGVFPCAGDDRWVTIAVFDDDAWRGLVDAMGDPEWASAPEFASHGARVDNIADLHARLAEWTAAFDDRELAERLQGHGVAAAPVNSVAGLLEDPQLQSRNTFVKVTHPLGFQETIYGAYVKTSVSEASVPSGPSIGQDNDRVFLELLGMPEDQYRQLVADQVIY